MEQLLERINASVSPVSICVHGHFYQPPREDPFTGVIPVEEGAAPYANYNEKITAECYRPNAELGNFDLISYDLGPTLAMWLEKAHPDVYLRMIEADRWHMERYGVGNALAQPYNHTILPLMQPRDKRTQILWGLQDFRHRYGHDAKGMWLAETAVNRKTLDVLAQAGVTYTVLAPWQAATPVDVTEPYLVRLPEGRSITVFFYNDLSGAVSYDDSATVDANQFAADYQRAYTNRDQAAGRAQITVIATDGELYGHHKPWRDKFLSHFLNRSASAYGLSVCSLERYLSRHPATKEVEICELSSWSCRHGVDRWSTGCSCTEGDGDWKQALREAITQLAEAGHGIFGYLGEQILTDPWAARNDYLALRNGWELPERFWAKHGRRMDIAAIVQAQQLLEAEYWLQYSFTSCGFFFEDLDRIEPSNNVAFARRAISLFWKASGHDLQSKFVKNLGKAVSWKTGRTGADLYHALPVVPVNLLPSNAAIS
jgi:alpha-amylase/alpha-mannosidase (GH57 family)